TTPTCARARFAASCPLPTAARTASTSSRGRRPRFRSSWSSPPLLPEGSGLAGDEREAPGGGVAFEVGEPSRGFRIAAGGDLRERQPRVESQAHHPEPLGFRSQIEKLIGDYRDVVAK